MVSADTPTTPLSRIGLHQKAALPVQVSGFYIDDGESAR